MTLLRSQMVIPMFTNIPRDSMTNTMHWQGTADLATAAPIIAIRLKTFYDEVFDVAGTSASYVNWADAVVKVYDLDDPEPRIPVIIPVEIEPTTPGTTNLPTEVSCVLSYHAAPISGVPQGRLRNRIYLGGIGEVAVASGSPSSFPTFSSPFRTSVLDAAETLFDSNDGSVDWVQHSALVIPRYHEIVQAWVDDSPDTQRRRSVDSTARTVRTF